MPPVDLPPALPAAPQPDVVDVTAVGAGEARPDGNEPHVLTVPVIVAPVCHALAHARCVGHSAQDIRCAGNYVNVARGECTRAVDPPGNHERAATG